MSSARVGSYVTALAQYNDSTVSHDVVTVIKEIYFSSVCARLGWAVWRGGQRGPVYRFSTIKPNRPMRKFTGNPHEGGSSSSTEDCGVPPLCDKAGVLFHFTT